MKNKHNQKHQRSIHQHIEHTFRHQYVVIGVIALMFVGLVKADIKMMTMMRDAYIHGFGVIGQYLREETSRTAESVNIGMRLPTISGE